MDEIVVDKLIRESQALVKSAIHSEQTYARMNPLNMMEFPMAKCICSAYPCMPCTASPSLYALTYSIISDSVRQKHGK